MDHEAEFQWLFLTEYQSVVRTTFLVLHDRERAEEITQDAFVQVLKHWAKVRQYESPGAWVRRIAIRLAVRATRRERLGRELQRQALSPPTGEGLALPDPEIMAALAALPSRQRAVVALFYLEDRPMDEIATVLGCSVATGWVHLHRARKRLAELLDQEGVELDVD